MKRNILMKLYLYGYGQGILPRWVRRLIARSEFHRSWLSGQMGMFKEQDSWSGKWRSSSVCDRQWHAYR